MLVRLPLEAFTELRMRDPDELKRALVDRAKLEGFDGTPDARSR